MKSRIHLRKKVFHSKKIPKLILIIVIVFFSTVFFLNYINKKASPILINLAEVEAKRIASIIVSKSITENVLKSLELDNLFIIIKNDNEKIESIDLNTELVNKILLESSQIVSNNLQYLQQGEFEKIDIDESLYFNVGEKELRNGVFHKIPLGVISNNVFLSNFGPKIPVKISLIGDLSTNLNNKITNYGLNNALFEVSISLELTMNIILPFKSSTFKAKYNVPIALKLIHGEIPGYYMNGYNQNSSILKVPVE